MAARRWLATFGACVAAVVLLLLVTVFTPAPYGDLTRVGALSEAAYGWREPQPAVDPRHLVSVALPQADVLVVGDSFSIEAGRAPRAGLVWQSRLVAAGLRVATVHWDAAQPLCDDFDRWLQAQGFHGRWVLLQSVERMLETRLRENHRCVGAPRVAVVPRQLPAPRQHPPAFALNTGERLLTGISTRWNTWRAARAADGAVFQDPSAGESTRVHRLPQGCALFSHAACDRVLFLAEDETKPRFRPEHVAEMARVAQPMRPWRTAWVVVPNKTSHYRDPDPTQAASAALAAAGLGPDVMAALRSPAAAGRDLYFPNDTHLSTRGTLLLGEAVLAWMGAAPAR